MRRKCISLFTIFTMLVTTFGGCDTSDATSGDTGSSDEQRVITLWTIATESDAFNAPFVQAIKDYEESHPDVKIEMETFENQAYKTKLKSAVASNELPDIFFTWGGGFSKSFVESGKVLALDEYYEQYKDELPEAAVSYATYDGTLYGTTYVTTVSMLYYNQKIFAQRGLTAPQTWEDLLPICESLNSANITPIALSAKDTWGLAMLHDALALKSAGHDKVRKALTREGQSYNIPEFLVAADKLRILIDIEAFSDKAANLSNDEAQAAFIDGEAAMYIMGSWTGGVISTDANDASDFDVVPIPEINGNAKATDFVGGAVDTLMVNAKTADKDLSANAAFELARSVSQYAFLDGAGIPAWTIDYDTKMVNPLSAKIADYTKHATSFTLWFDTLMEAEDAAEYLTLLQKLYANEIDAQEFVVGMDVQLSK